jgi:WD40 repeat protein
MLILTGHHRQVSSVFFSSNGRWLLSTAGFANDEARLFDLTTHQAVWVCEESYTDRFLGGAFTPDGNHLLAFQSRSGGRMLALDTFTEEPFPLNNSATRPAGRPIFSPDGTRLLARDNSDELQPLLHWWSCPSWQPLPTWTVSAFWMFRACNPVFSPDGRTLADVSGNSVILYEVPSGQERCRLAIQPKQGMATLAFDPTSRYLAAASGTTLLVWDLTTRAEVASLRQKRKYFLGVAFTRNGKFLGTTSNEATVKLWDTATWQQTREYAWEIGGLKCLAFSPDGMLAAAGSDKNRIVVWDLDD